MKNILKSILPNFSENYEIEQRLFELSLFLTFSVLGFWFIFGLFIGYGLFIEVIYAVGLLIYGGIYFLQKKVIAFRVLTLLYYYSALMLLAGAWLPSGGMIGPASTFLFLLFLSGLMVLSPRDYLVFILFSISLLAVYTYLELNNVDLAAKYTSPNQLIRDLSIANIIVFIIAGVAVYIFKISYLNDRKKLKKRNLALNEATTKAKSADQAKTNFLATISHEMRTPLNGIMGMTDLLATSPLTEDQKSLVHNLTYSTKILHGLISDVLDISTIEAGKMELNEDTANFKLELEELHQIFKNKILLEEKDLELKFDVNNEIPDYLLIDINRLRQILINLVNNAIKFTKKGSVSLKIDLLSSEGKKHRLQFKITDTGEGIRDEVKPEIFNRFFKTSENKTIEGTGLGLSIVKNLVELMGGKIAFDSTYGKGSTFWFELDFTMAEKPMTVDLPKQESKLNLTNVNILVVEDVKINQLVVTKILAGLGGKNFSVANNGEEAVHLTEKFFYDVIFMDLQMPGISGLEATKLILKNNRWATFPKVVALTANATQQDQDECKKAGMSDFVTKPFNVSDLKLVMEKLV